MDMEVLDEGLENVELVNACCTGGVGSARK